MVNCGQMVKMVSNSTQADSGIQTKVHWYLGLMLTIDFDFTNP